MPRYRLFGDTVDVAAMMNTTGEGILFGFGLLKIKKKSFVNVGLIFLNLLLLALKIHISLETKLLLDIHGCFKCEHRGAVEIKVQNF